MPIKVGRLLFTIIINIVVKVYFDQILLCIIFHKFQIYFYSDFSQYWGFGVLGGGLFGFKFNFIQIYF